MMDVVVKSLAKWVVLLFTTFLKRDRQIVLCTGWRGLRFADNSRYIYLYLCEHKEILGLKKIIWVTKSDSIYYELKRNGFSVCKAKSLKCIYYHLRAKYFLYDQFLPDFHSSLTYKAVCVNLWHGMPIKKFGLMSGAHADIWNLNDNYLLTCSNYGDQTLKECFLVRQDRLMYGMYPRNYYLLHEIPFCLDEELLYLQKIRAIKDSGKWILFYLPTFRNTTDFLFLGEKDPIAISSFFDFLEQQGYFLLTKIHFRGVELYQDGINIRYDNFMNLPADLDIYPFLKIADLLITDYSSVLFDFLYLNRSIICYPYDLQMYKEKDQGLFPGFDSLPADQVMNLNELKECLVREKTEAERVWEEEKRKEWLFKCFEDKAIEETITTIFSK